MEKNYSEKMPFINRVKEKKYLEEYFDATPSKILFMYWPKSTWKTALIKKVLDELSQEEYDINYINLRDVLMRDFNSFKNLFFPDSLKSKVKDSLAVLWKIWAFWFSWEPWEENIMNTDLFWLMKDKIITLNEKWIKPVIILDEFQYLKWIKIINPDWQEQRLIDELFKFFISLTKQFRLAHVVCLTSDSYFLDELYYETKLKNTSKFWLIDHLQKKDIQYRLWDLEKCPQEMIDEMWEILWWSVWEIWQVFVDYKNSWDWKESLDYIKMDATARAFEIYEYTLKNSFREDPERFKEEKEKYFKVCEKIVKDWFYNWRSSELDIEFLIKTLVDKDLWFYDSLTWKITANSESMRYGFGEMLRVCKK